MNEGQYRQLCEACDRVLLAPESTIERVAISWLHVIREHPVFLHKYVDLFEPTQGGKAIYRHGLRVLQDWAWWLRQAGRAVRSTGQPWSASQELPQQVDVLFVSHLLNASQAGKADDFYFSGLPNELASQGYSVVIALINHSGQANTKLAVKWRESVVPRLIFSDSLGILKDAALHRRLKKESFRLKNQAGAEKADLACKVFERASLEALSGTSRTTLRIGEQIGTLVSLLKPAAIVVTHEGHAWERMAFATARRVAPRVRCIGYQQAVLFRLQHAIRRNLQREYNPDHILTAGPAGKGQLDQVPGLEGVSVSVLGSDRGFLANSSDSEATLRPEITEKPARQACLVLPEGIASECHLLFEFSLACAQAYPEIQFIWRLHPVVTFKSLAIQNPKLRKLPQNIVLSQESLAADIARCRWALYRGTTAIIQAVGAGLRPLYLQVPGEISIDPLYEVGAWRIPVSKIDELRRAIETDETTLRLDYKSAFMSDEQYCRDFFSPLNIAAFKDAVLVPDDHVI